MANRRKVKKPWYNRIIKDIHYEDMFDDVSIETVEKILEEMEEEFYRISYKYPVTQEEKYQEYKEILNLWGAMYGRNILHLVAYKGYLHYAKFRLLYKSSLEEFDQKDDFGFTPRDYAEQEGHTEIVEQLKEFENKRVKK